jgi:TonB-like protein
MGRRVISALGALGSLVVHVGVMLPVLWSGYAGGFVQDLEPRPGGRPGVPEASQQSPMTVVFLDRPADQSEGTQELKSLVLSEWSLSTPIGHPDPISLAPDLAPITVEDEPTGAKEAADGPDPNTQLFGRYQGQITARIERMWLRPRTPIPGGSFACRVQVVQDDRGNVREVTPELCTGDAHWQQSLVRAIRSASPLPAPPDPAVFTSTLTLAFTAEPFVAGRSQDGYEPDTPETMALAERENSAAGFQQAIATLRSGRAPQAGSISLRIVGSPRPAQSENGSALANQVGAAIAPQPSQ